MRPTAAGGLQLLPAAGELERHTPEAATQLTITIHAMQVLPPPDLAPVLVWIQALSYPWCEAGEVARLAPRIELLAPILRRVASYAAGVQPVFAVDAPRLHTAACACG